MRLANDNSGAIELSDAQRRDWLRLIRSENIGPTTFRALLNRFGGAAGALEALPELSRRGGAQRRIKICSEQQADKELARAAAIGARLLAMGEQSYPARLVHIDGAPPLLYVRGRPEIFSRNMIAMVGARNCSAVGAKMASHLAAEFGRADLAIVSGMARGIDTAAHRSALNHGTVAVLAGGVDKIYPPENNKLYDEIIDTGAIVSEMPIGYVARSRDFPKRNRIISGMAVATIVVEAARRSGSLITARLAGEQGRDVFAVPGSPLDPRADGCNHLIKQGAGLVTEGRDVLDALQPQLADPDLFMHAATDADKAEADGVDWEDVASDDRAHVVAALGPTPIEIDELIRFLGMPTAVVRVVLLELEIAGRLARHTGDRVSLL